MGLKDGVAVQFDGLDEIKPLTFGFAPSNIFTIQAKINEIAEKVNLLIKIANAKIGK